MTGGNSVPSPTNNRDQDDDLIAKLSKGKALSLVTEDKRIISECSSLKTREERVNNFEQFATALSEVAEIASLVQSSRVTEIRTINFDFQEDSLQRQARSEQDKELLDYDFVKPSEALRDRIEILQKEIPNLERRFLSGSFIRNVVFFVLVLGAWIAAKFFLIK
jgi:hypothetical protein